MDPLLIRNYINMRLLATIFVLLFAIVFGMQFVYLSNGNVLNHYPFISPDGFDWYMEGVYVTKLLSGVSLPVLPVLRPPIFVLVTAADYATGNQGLALAIVLGFSIFCTYYFSLKIVDSVYERPENNSWYIVPLSIGTTLYSLNFFKPFILADALSVTLSIASVFLFIKYQVESKKYLLVLSIVIAVIAGLTQTYALIPYLVLCGVGIILNYKARKNYAIKCLIAIIAVSFLYVFFTAIWRLALPHGTTPSNFELLKFDSGMLGFYINTWSYYFLPFILFFMIFRRYRMVFSLSNMIMLSSAIILLVFSSLCFVYQWPEARFTYYLWPWLMIVFFTGIKMETIKGAYFISILMLLMVVLVPTNYWAPSWQAIHVRGHSWVGDYFSAIPVDRKLNVCSNDCGRDNEFLKNSDPYVNSTINTLNKIIGL